MFTWVCLFFAPPLAEVLQHAMNWADGCACHRLPPSVQSPSQRQRWFRERYGEWCLRCPLQGMKAPQLANGQFQHVVSQLFQTSLTELELSTSWQMDKSARGAILQDFIQARSYLMCIFRLKLAPWAHLPLRLMGLADHDQALARSAALQSLSLWDSVAERERLHPLCHEFLAESSPLRRLVKQFGHGEVGRR